MYTVKEAPKPPRWRISCENCGGTEVRQRSWSHWDEAKQNWVYSDGESEFYCDDCEDEVEVHEEKLP